MTSAVLALAIASCPDLVAAGTVHDTPAQVLADLRQAAAANNAAAFASRISDQTLSFLKRHVRNGTPAGALGALMDGLRKAPPWRVLRLRQSGPVAWLTVQDGNGPETLQFVDDRTSWKLDLTPILKRRLELSRWAEKVGKDMRRATPLVGLEGPGVHLLPAAKSRK